MICTALLLAMQPGGTFNANTGEEGGAEVLT